MHLILLYFLTAHSLADTAGKPFHWEKTKHWKMYALNNSAKVFALSVDTMPLLPAVPMSDDSIHTLLSTARLYQVPMSPAWMGCYLASCENDKGRLMKIVISVYGGFFLNELDDRYYHIDSGLTLRWLSYMRSSYLKTEK